MITYQELVQERFAEGIFQDFVCEATGCMPDPLLVDKAIWKAGAKVLKTLWPMMTALPEKDGVKNPWDSRESFEHLLPLVARKMYFAGVMAAMKGVGECVGFTKLEAFGAGYLFGDIGCGGSLERMVADRFAGIDSRIEDGHTLESAASAAADVLALQMDLIQVAQHASLDERKKYFENACIACYRAGASAVNVEHYQE